MAECSIQPHNLKHQFKDRRVRFHSLPDSKRFAESESDYKTIMHRHHAVLNELGCTHNDLYLVIPEYSASVTPQSPEKKLAELDLETTPWKTAAMCEHDQVKDEEPYYIHFHAVRINYPDLRWDTVFKMVADDEVAHVMIICPAGNWVFHPYDGGADVILKDGGTRDLLKNKYRDWLSARSDGL